MRLNNDEYFNNLDKKIFQQRLISPTEFKNEISVEEIKTKLKKYERARYFQIWHDDSTRANYGHTMFAANIFYDDAVFYTNAETLSGAKMNVQSFIQTHKL